MEMVQMEASDNESVTGDPFYGDVLNVAGRAACAMAKELLSSLARESRASHEVSLNMCDSLMFVECCGMMGLQQLASRMDHLQAIQDVDRDAEYEAAANFRRQAVDFACRVSPG